MRPFRGIAGIGLVVAMAPGVPVSGQTIPLPADSTVLAGTPGFTFHSDFWQNLSDHLYWGAQEDGPRNQRESCVAALSEADRLGWLAAQAHYERDMGERHHRRDPILRGLRYALAQLDDVPDSLVRPVYEILLDAAPAYRTCFWERQDRLNRERVANLVPLLIRYGPAVKKRLSAWYREPWPAAVHVDVQPYASSAGANTASGARVPPHMAISSIDQDLADLSGLELLLHEGSHEMFGPRHGAIGEAINRVSDSLGVSPPRNLWHALSFYSSGVAMEEVTGQAGVEYELRAWPEYLEPLRREWGPYLAGRTDFELALLGLIVSLTP